LAFKVADKNPVVEPPSPALHLCIIIPEGKALVGPHSSILAQLYQLTGPSRQRSFLQTIHQTRVFFDQLWASLSSATLDFK
jgi:hypothetical protein